MTLRRLMAIGTAVAILLALSVVALACGDDGGTNEDVSDGTVEDTSDIDAARNFMSQMVSAAQAEDLAAAQRAFDSAHDHLHEVIEVLESTDAELAAELEEAVDHAEEALEEGEEGEHLAEEAEEINNLLAKAAQGG